MTRGEAINWLINISADIGKREHKDLWHYEQALFEIREMLETQPERKKGTWIPSVDRWGDIITTVDGYTCSECGSFNTDKDNYCPNCGADMRGEQDDSISD